jgi:hypothetical protein
LLCCAKISFTLGVKFLIYETISHSFIKQIMLSSFCIFANLTVVLIFNYLVLQRGTFKCGTWKEVTYILKRKSKYFFFLFWWLFSSRHFAVLDCTWFSSTHACGLLDLTEQKKNLFLGSIWLEFILLYTPCQTTPRLRYCLVKLGWPWAGG